MSADGSGPSEMARSAVLGRVLGPVGPEVTCERCFELLDEYVETHVSGGRPQGDLRGMGAHLEGCPACMDDYRSLRDLLLVERSRGHDTSP